jgi:hypothetical protein
MSDKQINHVVSQWTRLGVMFNASASRHEVDVERLLLDTARCAPADSRLFILAVTWLVRHGLYVAKHRLAQLIQTELENEHHAAMGLMLDLAREKSANNSHRFNKAIEVCQRGTDTRTLFDIENRNEFFRRMAESKASVLSRKWGRWSADFELKNDAIRPAEWIVKHNQAMRWRGDFKGDLRASILAELLRLGSVDSESELARLINATRGATRTALGALEQAGHVKRERQDRRVTAQPCIPKAA